MSDGSEIAEDIYEEEYDLDFEEEDINVANTSQEASPRGGEPAKDCGAEIQEITSENVEIPDKEAEVPTHAGVITESNGANVGAANSSETIDAFSARLAERVVHEAILINEIYDRDKLNSNVGTEPRLGPRLESGNYDNYLIDKLLHSEADPNEDVNNASVGDADCHVTGDRHPGLDPTDSYVRQELDTARKDSEISDQNNNQMTTASLDGYGDTLQTIHEGLELDLHTDHVTQPGQTENQNVTLNGQDGAEPSLMETAQDPLDTDRRTDGLPVDESGNDGDAESNDDGDQEHSGADPTLPLRGILKVRQEEQKLSAGDQTPGEANPGEEEGKEAGQEVEESEEEEDEDCCEMTIKQKHRLVEAVREGDLDRLQQLMHNRNASLDMLWYGENLLTVAVRAGQEEMSLFLIDNGVDWRYETKLVEKTDNGVVKMYKRTLRQLAYEHELTNIVELIDFKTNHLFPFIAPPRERTLRLLEPLVPFESPPLMEGELLFVEESVDENVPEEGKGDKNNLRTKQGSDHFNKRRPNKDNKLSGNESGDSALPLRRPSHSSHRSSSDDLSQVFGPDLGSETTSPISKYMSSSQRHNSSSSSVRDSVSVRGTRSFSLMKAYKTRDSVDSNSDYPVFTKSPPVGSYNYEKRHWSVVKSAPSSQNYSVMSIPDSSARVGFPFVHADNRNSSKSSDAFKNNNRRTRSANIKSTVSPYAQVAQVLSESKLLNKNNKNRSSSSASSILPAITGKQIYNHESSNTRINYIYANRGSSDPYSRLSASHRFPSHHMKPGIKLDMLPKRKVRN